MPHLSACPWRRDGSPYPAVTCNRSVFLFWSAQSNHYLNIGARHSSKCTRIIWCTPQCTRTMNTSNSSSILNGDSMASQSDRMKQTVEKERSPPDRLRRSLLPPPSCCSLNGCTCRWQQQVQVNTKKTHRIMWNCISKLCASCGSRQCVQLTMRLRVPALWSKASLPVKRRWLSDVTKWYLQRRAIIVRKLRKFVKRTCKTWFIFWTKTKALQHEDTSVESVPW